MVPGQPSNRTGRARRRTQDVITYARQHPAEPEYNWASPRELLNILQADAIGCYIITVTPDILKEATLTRRDLRDYSPDTLRMFYNDAQQTGLTL